MTDTSSIPTGSNTQAQEASNALPLDGIQPAGTTPTSGGVVISGTPVRAVVGSQQVRVLVNVKVLNAQQIIRKINQANRNRTRS